jgi:hypothetical protein
VSRFREANFGKGFQFIIVTGFYGKVLHIEKL